MALVKVREATRSLWMSVCIGKIGFDVVERGAVHHVHARDEQYGTFVGVLQSEKTDTGEAYGIGTIG